MRGVGECGLSLRRAAFGVPFPREELVRAVCGHPFEKVGERGETSIPFAFFVERSGAQEFEFRTVVRIAVDLAVVELDRADGLMGGKARETFGTQTAVAAMSLILLQPCADCRQRNVAVGFLLEACSRLFEREAEIVVGERREDHAQRVGLVAKGCGAGRERALAMRTPP